MSSRRQQIGLFTKGLERPGPKQAIPYHPSVKEQPSKARQNQHPGSSPALDNPEYPFARQKALGQHNLDSSPATTASPSLHVTRCSEVQAVEQLDVEEGALVTISLYA